MANDGQASFDEYLCIAGAGDDKLTAGLMDMYYWSKIYENLDVFLVLLSGGTIGEYFAFHHLTVSSPVTHYSQFQRLKRV